jgi:hypothetical protein
MAGENSPSDWRLSVIPAVGKRHPVSTMTDGVARSAIDAGNGD